MKTCPICQQAYSDQTEYCARDGAYLSSEVREERECPYCAERILKKARVCRYCGRDVEPLIKRESPVPTSPSGAPEEVAEQPNAEAQPANRRRRRAFHQPRPRRRNLSSSPPSLRATS